MSYFPFSKKKENLHKILITLFDRKKNLFANNFVKFSILYSRKYLKNFREPAILQSLDERDIISLIVMTFSFPRNIQVFSKDRTPSHLLSSGLIRVSRYEYCPVNDIFECCSEMRTTTMTGVNANVH